MRSFKNTNVEITTEISFDVEILMKMCKALEYAFPCTIRMLLL